MGSLEEDRGLRVEDEVGSTLVLVGWLNPKCRS